MVLLKLCQFASAADASTFVSWSLQIFVHSKGGRHPSGCVDQWTVQLRTVTTEGTIAPVQERCGQAKQTKTIYQSFSVATTSKEASCVFKIWRFRRGFWIRFENVLLLLLSSAVGPNLNSFGANFQTLIHLMRRRISSFCPKDNSVSMVMTVAIFEQSTICRTRIESISMKIQKVNALLRFRK